jgi:hypothetical protein
MISNLQAVVVRDQSVVIDSAIIPPFEAVAVRLDSDGMKIMRHYLTNIVDIDPSHILYKYLNHLRVAMRHKSTPRSSYSKAMHLPGGWMIVE